MTDRNTELLPCPFCGSDDIKEGGDDKQVGAWCQECHAVGPEGYLGRSNWNTRAASTRLAEALGVITEARKDIAEARRLIDAVDNALADAFLYSADEALASIKPPSEKGE